MQLKSKLTAIASAALLAASIGVVSAGPAAATDSVNLWVDTQDESLFAYAQPIPKSGEYLEAIPSASPTVWNAPGQGTGQISLAGSGNPGLCMQVHDDDLIWLANCAGAPSEEWYVFAGSASGTVVYESEYGDNLCLTAKYPKLSVATCSLDSDNPNQEWYISPVAS